MEAPNLVMNWRSALLALFVVHLLIAALLLIRRRHDARANRLLAVLLIVIAGILTPQMIGFAGFYDAYPWLSFAPFANDMAVGPLIYAYVLVLTAGTVPAAGRLMFVPALVAFGYSTYWFLQPLPEKDDWVGRVHDPYVVPAMAMLAILLALVGIGRAAGHYRRYRRWLAENSSATAEFDPRWLPFCLVALGLPILAWTMVDVAELALGGLTYVERYPFYLLLGASGYGLALGALLQPQAPLPKMLMVAPYGCDAGVPAPASTGRALPGRDWPAEAARVRQRIEDEGWYLEPRLCLSDVARRLGTNETYLSRTLNRGAGVNFNRMVNEIRVAAVKPRLAAGEDVLSAAFACGFNAKATFNRVFRDITGETPSAFRTRADPASQPGIPTSHIP